MKKIIPEPKRIIEKNGYFDTKNATVSVNSDDILSLADILCEVFDAKKADNGTINLLKTDSDSEAYEIDVSESGVLITGGERGIFYAISTLKQLEEGGMLPCVIINDEPDFAIRGYYFDITRGRVPKPETLFKLVDKLAFYKMNHLELYVEHSFEYSGMEEIWGDKDPITREEIIKLDEYCRKNYVELVPSFALFGHLYEILRNPKFSHLCEIEPEKEYNWVDRMLHHTIDISNPQSFELIKQMIDDVLPLFSSDKFNICCDETFDLGKGKSRKYVEEKGIGFAYAEFVNKIANYVQSKGKKVLLWGDIVLKYPECMDKMAKDVTMLNWNYSAEPSEEAIALFKRANVPQIVCPGTSAWIGTLNGYKNAYSNITQSIKYAKKYEATGVLTTDWGDCGHINMPEYSFPLLALSGIRCWNIESNIDNKLISDIEFGEKDIWDKLTDASEKTAITYRRMVTDYYNIRNGKELREITGHTSGEYEKSIAELENYIEELPEHYLALKGEQLMNKFALCVIQNTPQDFSEEVNEYVRKYTCHWCEDYKKSELNRITDFFNDWITICLKQDS